MVPAAFSFKTDVCQAEAKEEFETLAKDSAAIEGLPKLHIQQWDSENTSISVQSIITPVKESGSGVTNISYCAFDWLLICM